MILFGSAGCCVCGVQNSLIKMEVVESLVLDKLCVFLKGVSWGCCSSGGIAGRLLMVVRTKRIYKGKKLLVYLLFNISHFSSVH